VPIHDPIPDDEQFERYLKRFRPLAPEALPTEERKGARSMLMMAAWAAVAAVVVVALLILYPRAQRPSQRYDAAQRAGRHVRVRRDIVPQPLTIESANALLTHAPSFKAAVDAMAVPSRTISFDGKQSALDVLSKDSKL
jgi:hypothetical protein